MNRPMRDDVQVPVEFKWDPSFGELIIEIQGQQVPHRMRTLDDDVPAWLKNAAIRAFLQLKPLDKNEVLDPSSGKRMRMIGTTIYGVTAQPVHDPFFEVTYHLTTADAVMGYDGFGRRVFTFHKENYKPKRDEIRQENGLVRKLQRNEAIRPDSGKLVTFHQVERDRVLFGTARRVTDEWLLESDPNEVWNEFAARAVAFHRAEYRRKANECREFGSGVVRELRSDEAPLPDGTPARLLSRNKNLVRYRDHNNEEKVFDLDKGCTPDWLAFRNHAVAWDGDSSSTFDVLLEPAPVEQELAPPETKADAMVGWILHEGIPIVYVVRTRLTKHKYRVGIRSERGNYTVNLCDQFTDVKQFVRLEMKARYIRKFKWTWLKGCRA